MKNALCVGLGGFFGCVARYLTSLLVERLVEASLFPYATLLVNVAGCFLIGFLTGSAGVSLVRPELRLFIIVGFLGGLTTFSTFGFETIMLARGERWWAALLNVAAHLTLGLGAVWAGMMLAKGVARP